jgi:hypothetical protein
MSGRTWWDSSFFLPYNIHSDKATEGCGSHKSESYASYTEQGRFSQITDGTYDISSISVQ